MRFEPKTQQALEIFTVVRFAVGRSAEAGKDSGCSPLPHHHHHTATLLFRFESFYSSCVKFQDILLVKNLSILNTLQVSMSALSLGFVKLFVKMLSARQTHGFFFTFLLQVVFILKFSFLMCFFIEIVKTEQNLKIYDLLVRSGIFLHH